MKKKVLNHTSHRSINTPHVREVMRFLKCTSGYCSDMDIWEIGNLIPKPATINRALQALHERNLADRIWHKADNGSRYYVYKLNSAGIKQARAVLK